MNLSPQQQSFVDFVRLGTGSAFGEAVAGAGKTTTALLAAAEMEGSVAVMAYNKAAAVEFVTKAKKLGLNFDNRVRFGTVHSFGLTGWRRAYPQVKCGPEAAREKADMTIKQMEKAGCPEKIHALVLKLVGLAKQRALGLFGSVDDRSEWWKIIEHFDLAYEIEEEGSFEETEGQPLIEKAIDFAIRSLKYHVALGPKIIDFDDMIYLPIVSGIKLWQNDWVVGDEWQDANAARRALVRKMLKPDGRALFIGDRHQAIYGFTGADNDSIDITIKEFNCTELALTVTYRCPKAVVAKAQEVVSHIQAHDTAPEGKVSSVDFSDFLAPANLKDLKASDAILCRKTKPLVSLAYTLIKQGIACHVEGRDIGAGLLKLVNRFQARSLEQLRRKLTAYCEQEVAKLTAKGKETQAEAVADRVETIFVIMDSQPPATSVDDLKGRIAAMFLDGANEAKPTTTLSTVHKAKGREWPRVFILGRNDYMPSPWARQEWQKQQELNIIYVSYTRAQEELILINGVESGKKS